MSALPLPGTFIELSEGEVLVRQYHITNSNKRKSRGDIAITSKRIIYQRKGKSSTVVKEVPIDSVSSINTYYGSGLKWGVILLGVFSIIFGIVTLNTVIGPIFGLIFGIIFLSNSFSTGYGLDIKSACVSGNAISVGVSKNGGILSSLFSISGQDSILINDKPTEQAIQMMHEIGAIVLDLKTSGDKVIDKWQKFSSRQVDTSAVYADIRSSIHIPDFTAINFQRDRQQNYNQYPPYQNNYHPQYYQEQPFNPAQYPPPPTQYAPPTYYAQQPVAPEPQVAPPQEN